MNVFVIGMHRSGTSLVASILDALGLYCGEEDDLLPPASDNVRGFWERKDVKQLNDWILKKRGCTWMEVSKYDEVVSKVIYEKVAPEILSIKKDLDLRAPWFIKDPRFCLTLPYWIQDVEKPTIIYVYRHPREVIQSLSKRNSIDEIHSLLLWQKYSLFALRNISTLDVFFIGYEDLINDKERWINELASFINSRVTKVSFKGPGLSHLIDHKLRHFHELDRRFPDKLSNRIHEDLLANNIESLYDFSKTNCIDSINDRLALFEAELKVMEMKTFLKEMIHNNTMSDEKKFTVEKRSMDLFFSEFEEVTSQFFSTQHATYHKVTKLQESNKELIDEVEKGLAIKQELISLQGDNEIYRANEEKLYHQLHMAKDVVRQEANRRRIKALEAKSEITRIISDINLFKKSWRWRIGNGIVSILEFFLQRNKPLLTINESLRKLENLTSFFGHSSGLYGIGSDVDSRKSSSKANVSDRIYTGRVVSNLKEDLKNDIDDELGHSQGQLKNLKIMIITPSTNIHGGTKRLVTIAHHLHLRGHNVKLIRQYDSRSLDWFDTEVPIYDYHFNDQTNIGDLERFFPNGDILITYGNNKSNSLLSQLSSLKGKKFSLFMHFGVHDRQLDVLNSNLNQFELLATTTWIQKEMIRASGRKEVQTIDFGVYSKQFFPTHTPKYFRIGSLYHTAKWKNSEQVIRVWKRLKRKEYFKDLELIMFGQSEGPALNDPNFIYVKDPDQSVLREIYSSCSAWISTSIKEGIGMCAVEAMLCQTPLIIYPNGGSEDYCTNENSLIVRSSEDLDFEEAIENLFTNYPVYESKARTAREDILRHTWNRSINLLESCLDNSLSLNNEIYRFRSKFKLSIGIPVHNQVDYLEKCIHSIYTCTSVSFEIIIVDDNSNGEIQMFIDSLSSNHCNIKYIRNQEQKGFPYNCNLISYSASGEYLCILNSDTVVTKGWELKLLEPFQKHMDLGITGPSTCYGRAKNYDEVSQQLDFLYENRFNLTMQEVSSLGKRISDAYSGEFYFTEYVNGFCMMIDPKVFSVVGFFDKKFGLGSREEVEFIDRLRSKGFKVGWVKDSYVHHYGHRSFDSLSHSKNLWQENKELYYQSKGLNETVGIPNGQILFLFNSENSSSTRKRTFEPIMNLRRFVRVEFKHVSQFSEVDMIKSSVIVLQRIGGLNELIDPSFFQNFKKYKQAHSQVKVVYDIDDFVIRSQNDLPLRLMSLCDVVVTPTRSFSEILGGLLPDIRIVTIQNGVNTDYEELGYHGIDIENCISRKWITCFSLAGAGIEVFNTVAGRLLKEGYRFEFHFFTGQNYDPSEYPNIHVNKAIPHKDMLRILSRSKYTFNFGEHSSEYFRKLKQQYGFLDVDKEPFINSKSGLKYYNAAICQSVFLSTPSPLEYSELIEHGINGYLFDSIEDLIEIIRTIENGDDSILKSVIQAAKIDVLSNYDIKVITEKYLDLFTSLTNEIPIE